jgi:ribulose 1,5-bisphosphate synthetase/thiazole synthase
MQKFFSKVSNKYTLNHVSKRYFSSSEYDLAVIGGGPGGYVAAIKAA